MICVANEKALGGMSRSGDFPLLPLLGCNADAGASLLITRQNLRPCIFVRLYHHSGAQCRRALAGRQGGHTSGSADRTAGDPD